MFTIGPINYGSPVILREHVVTSSTENDLTVRSLLVLKARSKVDQQKLGRIRRQIADS